MASTTVMQRCHAHSKLLEGKWERYTLFADSFPTPSLDSGRFPNADLDRRVRSFGVQGSDRLTTPQPSPVRKQTGDFEIDVTELDFRGAQPAGKVNVPGA